MSVKSSVVLLCALSFLPLAEAAPARVEGVSFDRSFESNGTLFQLHSTGLLRYRVIFRAYVGALYIGEGRTLGDLWREDTPLRLELEYFWPIAGDQFGPAAEPFLDKNLNAAQREAVLARVHRINQLYRDVEPGDRYALTYVPGVGTELALNGEPLGVIEGGDFAVAYFRIWLGDYPVDTRFRDQLLRRR